MMNSVQKYYFFFSLTIFLLAKIVEDEHAQQGTTTSIGD